MNRIHATASLVVLLTGGALSAPVAGQAAAPGESGNTLVKVVAESSIDTIHSGETFLLAFRFEIAPHWHIYWKNPGETGSPTQIEVIAPDGFEVGDILWQRPRLIPGMFTTFGYEDEAVLFVPVTAPAVLSDGEAAFHAELNWLVCQESCLMGDATLDLSLPTSAAPGPESGTSNRSDPDPCAGFRFDIAHVREWLELVPRDLSKVEGAAIEREGSLLTLTGPAHGETFLTFFPSHSPGVNAAIVKQVIENDRFVIVLDVKVNPTATLGKPPVASGVIALGTDDDDPSYSFEAALE